MSKVHESGAGVGPSPLSEFRGNLMAKQNQTDARKSVEGKPRNPKGGIKVTLKTASFMFGTFRLILYLLPRLERMSPEQAEAHFKNEAVTESLRKVSKQTLTEGVEFFSHAFIVEGLLNERSPTRGLHWIYCIVRFALEYNGKLPHKKLSKKDNDKIMALVWRVSDIFPLIQERIALEQGKGTRHFQSWRREQRFLATEEYPRWKEKLKRVERIKSKLLAELAEFLE